MPRDRSVNSGGRQRRVSHPVVGSNAFPLCDGAHTKKNAVPIGVLTKNGIFLFRIVAQNAVVALYLRIQFDIRRLWGEDTFDTGRNVSHGELGPDHR
jgi:hypothetical protein